MSVREYPDLLLSCGHWSNLLGALRVLGSVMGQLEQYCDKCEAWIVVPPPKKSKPRKAKAKPDKDVLF